MLTIPLKLNKKGGFELTSEKEAQKQLEFRKLVAELKEGIEYAEEVAEKREKEGRTSEAGDAREAAQDAREQLEKAISEYDGGEFREYNEDAGPDKKHFKNVGKTGKKSFGIGD